MYLIVSKFLNWITVDELVPFTNGGRLSDVGLKPGFGKLPATRHWFGPEFPQYCAFEFTAKRQKEKRVKITFFM